MKFFYVYMELIVWSIIFCSCQNIERKHTSNLVLEWIGKDIKFPEESIFSVIGKNRDTINLNKIDASFKILSYVDSVGCTSCRLEFRRWKTFISELILYLEILFHSIFIFVPPKRL